eukprot:gene15687-18600_t
MNTYKFLSFLALLLFFIFTFAFTASAHSLLLEAQRHEDWIVSLRREFHKIPELAFEEVKTSALVRKTLDELQIPYTYPWAITGVVGIIEGHLPGPTVALRADFDALPIDEQVDIPFKSIHPGRMHACGHDAHASMLLGAARILKDHQTSLRGTVRLLFQPAEEGGAGGKRMFEEGALGDSGSIFGLHITPGLGRALPSGTLMAATGRFEVTIHGAGGHAAKPDDTIDPVVAGSAVVMALQTIVARQLSPLEAGVVSVTQFHGGTTNNVIPHEVFLGGTFRSLTQPGWDRIKQEIRRIIVATAAAYNCNATIDFMEGVLMKTSLGEDYADFPYPATSNDPVATAFAARVAEEVVGIGNVSTSAVPTMGGEDFSFYAQAIPACFLFLGHRNEEKGCTAPNHSPHFKVDEDVLHIGSALHASFAMQWLHEQSTKHQEL